MKRFFHRLVFALTLLVGARCMPPREDQGPVVERTEAMPATATSTEPSDAIVVDYGPCTIVGSPDPNESIRCIPNQQRELRLWLRPAHAKEAHVLVDGHRVPTRALEPVEDRSRGFVVRLPDEARAIEVVVPSTGERWMLPLGTEERPIGNVEADEAWAAADRFRERVWTAEPVGDWEQEFLRIDEQLARLGLPEPRVRLGTAVVYSLAWAHRFDEAARVLEHLDPLARRAPRLQARLAYSRGAMRWRQRKIDRALIDMRTASQHAMRADDPELGYAAFTMYADLLTEQGYVDAALRWSQRGLELARARGTPCDVASTLRTTAWIHLLLRRQGSSNHDPEPLLREALALFETNDECPDRTGGTRLSLATVELLHGRPAAALEMLGPTSGSPMSPDERMRALDVEVKSRLALGQDRARVDRAFARMQSAVETDGTIEARWHLAVRHGQLLEARGNREAAVKAYREAEAHLDALARLAGLGVGRSATGLLHRESSERLVDALRASGRVEDALCVARQTEARRLQSARLSPSLPHERREQLELRDSALRAARARYDGLLEAQRELPSSELAAAQAEVLEQQQRLTREADELLAELGVHTGRPRCDALHQPEAGELLLGLFPRGDGWLLFAHDEHETTVHAVELRELDLVRARARLSELLLRPIAEQLHRARRIRVHAVGQAQRIDVDLLPWEGKLLIAHVPVVYGVDVVEPEALAPAKGGEQARAVLLADPTGSLPDADAEIEHAGEQLRRMGWAVEPIPRSEARPHVLAERMEGARLLHYAGHAEHDERLDPGWWPPYAGGTPSWPASLRLADGVRLAAPEILTNAGRVPPMVILSGCRTGALDTASTGMSLAVAFLMAGSQEVLATSVVTSDAEARDAVRALYDELATSDAGESSLGEVFARSQSRRLEGRPEVGSAAGHYRVWVR